MSVKYKIIALLFSICFLSCKNPKAVEQQNEPPEKPEELQQNETQVILPGAYQIEEYKPLIQGKNLALVVNQTSMIGTVHLADSLLRLGIDIRKIFAPEHGFRGTADAGEQIVDGKDAKTGIPLISLYGSKKKPSPADLADIDLVVFDIQDVGARFYTYISSMHYVMEACAENNIDFLVLDRPNPNGHYVDGPVLDPEFKSFVGMHPVPVVHGMTIAEYARMINGEGWLADGQKCNLKYIKCENYDHNLVYNLPVKPSPNLPNMRSIYLYPSLCFFEGTDVNVGRGTDKQFQVYGHPQFQNGDFSYTPASLPGAKNPKHLGKLCKGYDLTVLPPENIRAEARLNLSFLLQYYEKFPQKEGFFLKNNFFNKLAGNPILQDQIKQGLTETEIRANWQVDLASFKTIRKKYLLYPDFD